MSSGLVVDVPAVVASVVDELVVDGSVVVPLAEPVAPPVGSPVVGPSPLEPALVPVLPAVVSVPLSVAVVPPLPPQASTNEVRRVSADVRGSEVKCMRNGNSGRASRQPLIPVAAPSVSWGMRLARPLSALLVVACGDGSSATLGASATDSASSSTGPGAPTTVTPTTADSEAPTGSVGATDSGTSTGTSTGTTTGESSGTTAGVHTDTLPGETTSTGPDTTTTSTGPGDTSSSDGSDSGSEESSTGGEACPCPNLEVPLDDGIFVLSDTGELWKYLPKDNLFTLLGELGCDLQPPTFSMAVDRLGYAWVQYPSGALRKVAVGDVTDCTDPGYAIGQQGVQNFGMAFVSNSASDKCDRIYGSEYNGFPQNDFFSIDPANLQLMKLGFNPSGIAELTGTGDGRAFLFTATFPPALVEVDKADGMTVATKQLPGVNIGSGLAFAFFGGDFYLFTDSENDFTSEVTHLDYDDSDMNGQALVQVFDDAPLRILGAGVSTCAPTLPQ